MSLKLSIYLPNESLEKADSLQNFISDLGDILVDYNFGNDISVENPDETELESLNSYIIISTEENLALENLKDAYLVIPVNSDKGDKLD